MRKQTRLSLFALLTGLVGCGELDHKDYVAARSDAECSKMRSCARGYFESEYRDQDDCVDEVGDDLDDHDDNLPDSCDYDGAEASACVSRIRSMSCEEYAEQGSSRACDLVWKDDGGEWCGN